MRLSRRGDLFANRKVSLIFKVPKTTVLDEKVVETSVGGHGSGPSTTRSDAAPVHTTLCSIMLSAIAMTISSKPRGCQSSVALMRLLSTRASVPSS